MFPALTAFVIAMIIAAGLIPVLSVVARKIKLVDKPDATRKLHKSAIPLVGGIGVFVAVVVTVGLVFWLGQIPVSAFDAWELTGLLLACGVVLGVGILDDRFNLRGRQKLIGQILAVTILIVFGYRFDGITIMGIRLEFGVFAIAVVYAWCLAAINSVNLLDGADGFAGTIGFILCAALAVMGFYMPTPLVLDSILCFAMAGALGGFLFFNFPPARVYLGDAGSMLIGLFLAGIAIRCTLKQQVAYAVFAPVALLAIPFIDTSAAIIRRQMTGRSIYTEDRGHLHHVLAKKGLSPVSSLLWVGALCSMTAAGGTISLIMHQAEYALASIVMVIVVMVAGKIFGVAEFQLIWRRIVGILRSLLVIRDRHERDIQQSSIQIQGHRDWSDIWERLCDFAQDHELSQIQLDVNAPWMHEAFHATWKKGRANSSGNHQWQVELPMIVEGKILGRVKIFAPRDCRFSHHDIVVNLMKVTQDIELILTELQEQIQEATIESPPDLSVENSAEAPSSPRGDGTPVTR